MVDDEPSQRLIMARLLKRAGYNVATAANGREALSEIRAQDFHILITGWDMPEMDGISLCKAVRNRSDKAYLYTILLTSRDAVEHLVAGLGAGADDYLIKPVVEPELIARLNTARRIVTLERSLRHASQENERLVNAHPLTGVYHRGFLMKQLPQDLNTARVKRYPISLILCDADYLKSINDRYGHDAGGRTLIAMAELLNIHARNEGGWLAHHGGDEFSIVLPRVSPVNAYAVADGIRYKLANEVMFLAGIQVRITASFGVAGWDRVPAKATPTELLKAADECMYESKAAGRNCVSLRQLAN